MFGMGWTELLLIGIVALIVVGPKDLPVLFRTLGQFVGKARGMAREFSRAMEEAADQSGVKEATDAFKGLSNPKKYGLDKVKDAADFTKWDPDSETGKLAKDRAENAEKIRNAAAAKAQQRLDAEATAKAASSVDATPDAAASATAPATTDDSTDLVKAMNKAQGRATQTGATQADAVPDADTKARDKA